MARARHRRLRHRHLAGDAAARLRPVHPGSRRRQPLARRPRHRPGAGPPPGRDARRHHRRRAATARAAAACSRCVCRSPPATARCRRPRRRARRAAHAAPRRRRRRQPRCRATRWPCWWPRSAARPASPATARPASTQVLEWSPTLVLLDIGMPGMDGYETCRRIREAIGHARRAIVALTGWGQEQDKRDARAGRLRRPPDQARRPGRARAAPRRAAAHQLARSHQHAPRRQQVHTLLLDELQ